MWRRLTWLVAVGMLTACGDTALVTETLETERPPVVASVAPATDTEVVSPDVTLDALCRTEYADVEPPADIVVGLVTDTGSINDGTFNQSAYEGMRAAARCFGVETPFIESAGTDYGRHIATLIDRDADAVVTVGFLLGDATARAASRHPATVFVGVDQAGGAQGSNYAGVAFRDDQAGFLAGAAAGLLTATGTVAVVAGPDDVPPVVALADGYAAGARYVDSDITVLRRHIDSFVDAEAGAEQARRFLDDGADVVYNAGGLTGAGAVVEAARSGAWGIGVDQDEYYTTFAGGSRPGADRLATSAIKRVDLAVFMKIAEVVTERFDGGLTVLDAASGGVTYAPFHDADVPPQAQRALEDIRTGLASGDIDTGVD